MTDASYPLLSEQHEHVFVEEQEPSPDGNHPGRLILPPCIVCDLTAMDALEQVRMERDRDTVFEVELARLREVNRQLRIQQRGDHDKLTKIQEWAENRDPAAHGMEQDSPHTDRFFHGYSVALDRVLDFIQEGAS